MKFTTCFWDTQGKQLRATRRGELRMYLGLSQHHTSFVDKQKKQLQATEQYQWESKAKEMSERQKARPAFFLGIFLVYYLLLKFNVSHYSPVHMVFMNISISLFQQKKKNMFLLEEVPPSSCTFSTVLPAAYEIRCKLTQVHTKPLPVSLVLPTAPSNEHVLLTSPHTSSLLILQDPDQNLTAPEYFLSPWWGRGWIFHLLIITRYLTHVFLQLTHLKCHLWFLKIIICAHSIAPAGCWVPCVLVFCHSSPWKHAII